MTIVDGAETCHCSHSLTSHHSYYSVNGRGAAQLNLTSDALANRTFTKLTAKKPLNIALTGRMRFAFQRCLLKRINALLSCFTITH